MSYDYNFDYANRFIKKYNAKVFTENSKYPELQTFKITIPEGNQIVVFSFQTTRDALNWTTILPFVMPGKDLVADFRASFKYAFEQFEKMARDDFAKKTLKPDFSNQDQIQNQKFGT